MKLSRTRIRGLSRVLIILALICSVNTVMARQKIRVSAFYSDYPLRFRNVPDSTWTVSPFIQVRIEHKFCNLPNYYQGKFSFNNLFFLTQMVPLWTFPSFRVKTDKDIKYMNVTDFNNRQVENEQLKSITYSYLSPTTLLQATLNGPQTFYAMSNMESWFATNSFINDSIDIEFDMDSTLFHIRTSRPCALNEGGERVLTIKSNEEEPSFYLYYTPAYVHKQQRHGGRMIDLLLEKIDTLKSNNSIIYYTNDDGNKEMGRLLRATDILDSLLGVNKKFALNVSISSQCLNYTMGGDSSSITYSRVHGDDSYALMLLNKKDFETNTLLHELLHLYLPEFKSDNKIVKNLFGEALVEYVSAYYSKKYFEDTNVFLTKAQRIHHNSPTIQTVRKILADNVDVEVNLSDDNKSTDWIYYDYIPYEIHRMVQSSNDEEKVVRFICKYLLSISEKNQPSIKDFELFMAHHSIRCIPRFFKQIIP